MGLSGETGKNPVRARRRNANYAHISSPCATAGERPLEFSEKADMCIAKPEYPDTLCLPQTAAAGLKAKLN